MSSTLPKAIRNVTQELLRLPGIGPKTAQRLAIHLLRQPSVNVERLAETLKNLHSQVKICSRCFNVSENETCIICRSEMRDSSMICVVEDALDVDALEKAGVYTGLYHVLGGVLSPMEGVMAEQLTIKELLERADSEPIKEIILALDHTMESEATARYITKHLEQKPVTVSRLAKGLPTGGDIEFADSLTLAAAMSGRKLLWSIAEFWEALAHVLLNGLEGRAGTVSRLKGGTSEVFRQQKFTLGIFA